MGKVGMIFFFKSGQTTLIVSNSYETDAEVYKIVWLA